MVRSLTACRVQAPAARAGELGAVQDRGRRSTASGVARGGSRQPLGSAVVRVEDAKPAAWGVEVGGHVSRPSGPTETGWASDSGCTTRRSGLRCAAVEVGQPHAVPRGGADASRVTISQRPSRLRETPKYVRLVQARAEHATSWSPVGADPVQVHPPVVLLLAGRAALRRQPPYVVVAPRHRAARRRASSGMRSIGPSTISPVATSSTRSAPSSSPPVGELVGHRAPSLDGCQTSRVVVPAGSSRIGSSRTRSVPSGST